MHVRSALTAALVVTFLAAYVPDAVAALGTPTSSALATSSTGIRVSWIDGNLNVTSFQIERSLKRSTGFKRIAMVTAGLRNYQDGGLLPATTYYYRVRTKVGTRYSRRSAVVSATTFLAGVATAAPTVTPVRTSTPLPTATPRPSATRTATQVPQATATITAVPTAVATTTAIRTATAVPTTTRTATPIPTVTRTATPLPSATRTATPLRTATPVPTVQATAVPVASGAPWARRVGGGGTTMGEAIAIDSASNSILVGSFTASADFGGGSLTSAGSGDVYVAKYSPRGDHLWSKRFGGAGNDGAYEVAVDHTPNCDGQNGTDCILVTGTFEGSASFGGASLASAGDRDIFVAKYSAAGAHLWSRRFGNTGADAGYGIAVDASGSVLLTGYFSGSTDFGGGMLYSPYANWDTFVVKLSSAGNHVWSKNYWNVSSDVGNGIAVDRNGDAFLTGFFMGGIDFGLGVLRAAGAEDVYVAKISGADGHGLWAKSFGQGSGDIGYAIATDGADNVVVTGSFSGTVDFGGGPFASVGEEAFVAKYSPTGAHLWSRHFGGSLEPKRGFAIAGGAGGETVVTGMFQGSADFGGGVLTSVGYSDVFAAKYDAAGGHVWSRRYGSSGADDLGDGAAIDPGTREIVISGSFQGRINFGTGDLTNLGLYNGFVTRLLP